MWNVQGLNAQARHNAVRETVDHEHVSLLYLQETKLNVSDDVIMLLMLGTAFDYCFLPAANTRGVILIA